MHWFWSDFAIKRNDDMQEAEAPADDSAAEQYYVQDFMPIM